MYPRLLDTDHFVLHSFGAFLVIAFLVSLWWVTRGARRQGINARAIFVLSVWLMVGGLIGAKLLKVVRLVVQDPASIPDPGGAGDFYGGFLGALVVALVYFRRHRELNPWKVADLYGPTLALGQAIGRIGCFMAGDDYGTPTQLPWAIVFTDPEAARIGGTPLGVRLHPVQLYESLVCFALFFFLVWLARRKRFDGQIILTYALGYAVTRFLIEFFRGDVDRGFLFSGLLSTSQFIALMVGGAAAVMLVRRAMRSDM